MSALAGYYCATCVAPVSCFKEREQREERKLVQVWCLTCRRTQTAWVSGPLHWWLDEDEGEAYETPAEAKARALRESLAQWRAREK